MNEELKELTPKQTVAELDKYIIGQNKAKRAVAIALRNRMRRLKLPEEIRDEIAPKNILMIGPTGVGKTEIARRLAKLSGAPFLKVEATKYTEVGYVGRDVESMIRDLMAVGYTMVKSEMQEKLKEQAEKNTEESLLDLLLPGSNKKKSAAPAAAVPAQESSHASAGTPIAIPSMSTPSSGEEDKAQHENDMSGTREKFRVMLREGKLEDKMVEVTISPSVGMPTFEFFAGGSNMEDIESAMSNISNMIMGGAKSKRKNVSVKEAREIIMAEQLDRMVDHDKVTDEAKQRVEQMGIIFIDEIDKVASRSDRGGGPDVSREGVQRDILPIVEGSKVSTKYGVVDTRHILFIAAGAFSVSKPSDLIPEFQGRFPLRVELEALHAEDFKRILLEPKNALTKQYAELLQTEGVKIEFLDEAIDRMSFLAADVNSKNENIGARRLHTIMEMLLEDISFNASEMSGETVRIDVSYVDERLKDIVQDQDLSRYIL
ncbi:MULTISPECIES: ATP-dependent protease ATPase subunit HslU [unclassified Treponema]|uniref:ATP-dependent protease ATPase subunit HslU n=1 Tax=unclassified Treponema TaxID=2638727 RepID=UPI0020A3BEF2|nr:MULTISPECIES: ATP-dependent protease ATPase subunit HslU [unclassified Treponema]UTC65878.1 ATP-dependent protease ATPase subunit HslU [Treponema sp. OMZ 789]UTC68606.1 ATP-dependent protease ATPase subunit HslU [Treponema sp. OMZ 790]UTC71336.1 ATP-dependent protease ATPase subunit HslU [Treponema sp. OMZ 791]